MTSSEAAWLLLKNMRQTPFVFPGYWAVYRKGEKIAWGSENFVPEVNAIRICQDYISRGDKPEDLVIWFLPIDKDPNQHPPFRLWKFDSNGNQVRP